MRSPAIIAIGRLGWSNKRVGTEVYAEQGERRWGLRRRHGNGGNDGGWGDLLVDHLEDEGAHEGDRIVLVVLPKNTPEKTMGEVIPAVMRAVHDVIAPDEAWISVGPGEVGAPAAAEPVTP